MAADAADGDIATLTFANHIILRPLGRGGMSTVWLARDPASMRLRAIKVMNRRRTDSQATLDRFVQEFKLLSPMESPYIIRAYEQDTSDDRAWLAIEFFPAGTLERAGIDRDLAGEVRGNSYAPGWQRVGNSLGEGLSRCFEGQRIERAVAGHGIEKEGNIGHGARHGSLHGQSGEEIVPGAAGDAARRGAQTYD